MPDQNIPDQPLATLPDAHRVVIVDDVDGRVFDESSRYEHGAVIHVQDDGRTVKILPAPPKSLAEQILDIAGGISSDFGAYADDLNDLADRVEAVEKELAGRKRDYIECQNELLASEEELKETRRERDEARAEVERLTATFKEPLKEPGHLPDPADVPEEELWVMDVDGQRLVGFRSGEPVSHPWETFDLSRSGGGGWSPDRVVRLRHRLVPDTRRVIDRVEALDALPVGSIVIDGDDDPWKKTRSGEWILGEDYQTSDELLRYIATSLRVIHEPEVTA